ncbi:excise: DNA binding domain, excisionase family [Antarctobacter heliothermus]|uniref:Excise: DNA binding domain, excisionase family n=1 Tax=Antarctobacter heliothermus TaxID=74033 RepID=A0A222E7B4_9RHOB|nr:helix-turn-helix domain-containing protein [Antarctobacter heliothermus]ASP22062.1 excise: DNA binding domain, excisionase family [Antarctobacter heliothermus]
MSLKLKKTTRHLLTSAEAAEIMGVSKRFLDLDRHESRANGTPPKIPYTRLGHRSVRYRYEDVKAYIDANVVGG